MLQVFQSALSCATPLHPLGCFFRPATLTRPPRAKPQFLQFFGFGRRSTCFVVEIGAYVRGLQFSFVCIHTVFMGGWAGVQFPKLARCRFTQPHTCSILPNFVLRCVLLHLRSFKLILFRFRGPPCVEELSRDRSVGLGLCLDPPWTRDHWTGRG